MGLTTYFYRGYNPFLSTMDIQYLSMTEAGLLKEVLCLEKNHDNLGSSLLQVSNDWNWRTLPFK